MAASAPVLAVANAPATPSPTNGNAAAKSPTDDSAATATKKRTGPNASQSLLASISKALNEGIRVYGADAGRLSDYVQRVNALITVSSMGKSAKMTATFGVVQDMLKLTVPPADASPVSAPSAS